MTAKNTALSLILIAASGVCHAADSKCASIGDTAKRLACYDSSSKPPVKAAKLSRAEQERRDAQNAEAERVRSEKEAEEKIAAAAAAQRAADELAETQRLAAIALENAERQRAVDQAKQEQEDRLNTFVTSAKRTVAEGMKDPESSRFTELYVVTAKNNPNDRSLCGKVNAKNSYGGYVGAKTFVYSGEQQRVYLDGSEKGFGALAITLNILGICKRETTINDITDVI